MHAVSVKEELGWKGWSRFRPDRLCVTTAAVAARRVSVALLLPSSSGPSISPVSAVRALSLYLSLFPFSLASFPSFTTGGQRLHRSPPPPFFLSSIGGAFSFLFFSYPLSSLLCLSLELSSSASSSFSSFASSSLVLVAVLPPILLQFGHCTAPHCGLIFVPYGMLLQLLQCFWRRREGEECATLPLYGA